MRDTMTATTPAPSRTCDCCKERVRLTDEDGLCFNCDLVRTFATIIEEQTDLAGDAAIDLACVLVDCARSRILEIRDDMMKRRTFSRTSALGWFGLRKITEGERAEAAHEHHWSPAHCGRQSPRGRLESPDHSITSSARASSTGGSRQPKRLCRL